MTDEIKKEEVKAVIKSDIFVTEDDTFEVNIKYYNKDGKLFVKTIDEDFDDTFNPAKSLNITLKYPSQGDCIVIERSIASNDNATENLKTFLRMEYHRFLVLARKWSLLEKFDEPNIIKLQPKIVKGILHGIREKINLDGLV